MTVEYDFFKKNIKSCLIRKCITITQKGDMRFLKGIINEGLPFKAGDCVSVGINKKEKMMCVLKVPRPILGSCQVRTRGGSIGITVAAILREWGVSFPQTVRINEYTVDNNKLEFNYKNGVPL